jgi:hypothetical protein
VLTHLAEARHEAGRPDAGRDPARRALTLLDGLDQGDPERLRDRLRRLGPF